VPGNSFCCGAVAGASGSRPGRADKPAHNRIREAATIPALEVFVVSCPKDLTMFEDALKAMGHEEKFVVKGAYRVIRERGRLPALRGRER